MQTRTKESKKRLHSLILLTAFTAVLLIVSTYAWFTSQKNVSISNIKGKVQVAEGLEISLDGEKWTQTLDLDDGQYVSLTAQKPAEGASQDKIDAYNKLIYKPYETHENNVPQEFKPVSTSGETYNATAGMEIVDGRRDKLIMLSGNYDGEFLRDVNLCSDLGGNYFAFDIFIRNSSMAGKTADVLQLNHTSSAWVSPDGSDENDPAIGEGFEGNPVYGIQNTVRVAFARYGAASTPIEDGVQVDETSQYYVKSDATPATIIRETDLMPITGVSIWEPNANAHVANAVENTKILFDRAIGTGNPVQTTFLTNQTANKFFTKTLNYKSIEMIKGAAETGRINVFDWDETTAEPYKSALNYLHTTQTTSLDNSVIDAKGDVIQEDLRYPMIEDGVQNLKLIEIIDNPNTVDLKDGGGTINTNDSSYDFRQLDTDDLTIAANSITKFRVYIWIEGQDPDCTNYASSGGGLEINLSLAKGQDEYAKSTVIEEDDRATVCKPGTCYDADPIDAKCDVCGSFVSCAAAGRTCADSADDPDGRDGKCDICARPVACIEGDDERGHKDAKINASGEVGRDALCDYCGSKVECGDGECIDVKNNVTGGVGRDALCDVCGTHAVCTKYGETCADSVDNTTGVEPRDAKCDVCAAHVKCADSGVDGAECDDTYNNVTGAREKDGLCDICDEEVEEVVGS